MITTFGILLLLWPYIPPSAGGMTGLFAADVQASGLVGPAAFTVQTTVMRASTW
ncbi:MAG TPA: hypothetical protein VEI07_18660 [Planctomycetaceae bacterium]|nr:hypothetical protein [Planctomycetaceae bacterium]